LITAYFKRLLVKLNGDQTDRACIEPLENRSLLAAHFTELPGGSSADMVAFNGKTYYGNDVGLYATDGTPGGTTLIHPFLYTDIRNDIVGGDVFFVADDGVAGLELWKTDGTTTGTQLVADINPGPLGSNLQLSTAFRGRIYLSADDGTYGTEPYVSDGSAQGTVMLADIAAGSAGSYPSGFEVGANNRIYFSAEDESGYRLPWSTRGLTTNTAVLKDIGETVSPGDPDRFLAFHHKTYFVAHNNELWRTDGTSRGTVPIISVAHAGDRLANDIRFLFVFRGHLMFTTHLHPFAGGTINSRIYSSDGTAAGTKSIASFGKTSSIVAHAAMRKLVIFTVMKNSHRNDSLWKSDGTLAGTAKVIDLPAGSGGPFNMMVANRSNAFFVTGDHGSSPHPRIWQTDGTKSGTNPLAWLPTSDAPLMLALFLNRALFVATVPLVPDKPTHLHVINLS
jgi:ELWxxDGT repeat protein